MGAVLSWEACEYGFVLCCFALLLPLGKFIIHATKVGWLYDVLVVVKLKELLRLAFNLLSAYKVAIS